MSRTKWQALLRSAQPVCDGATVQLPALTQVAVAATQPVVRAVVSVSPRSSNGRQTAVFLLGAAEAAFAALQDAELDPIAEAERAAIQDDVVPQRQSISQGEMVAGLLAAAGKPRLSIQAETRVEVPAAYCMPCGALVPDGRRKWSDKRGWCCDACLRGAA